MKDSLLDVYAGLLTSIPSRIAAALLFAWCGVLLGSGLVRLCEATSMDPDSPLSWRSLVQRGLSRIGIDFERLISWELPVSLQGLLFLAVVLAPFVALLWVFHLLFWQERLVEGLYVATVAGYLLRILFSEWIPISVLLLLFAHFMIRTSPWYRRIADAERDYT